MPHFEFYLRFGLRSKDRPWTLNGRQGDKGLKRLENAVQNRMIHYKVAADITYEASFISPRVSMRSFPQ